MAKNQQGFVLVPGAKIAARWEGALRSRLNRAPLEAFLRSHSQQRVLIAPQAVTESLVRASFFILDPVLPHRGEGWRSVFHWEYFKALGEAMSLISVGISDLIEEPRLWRVAALSGLGRLLTPVMGIDMAACTAAAFVASFAVAPLRPVVFDPQLAADAASAVKSLREADLMAMRSLIFRGLSGIVERGGAKISLPPLVTTISASPPSNH